MSKPRLIYLLIEEANRELDARLLVAAELAALGLEVVIAPQWSVWEALADLPRGVMLFKGNNAAQANSMQAARQTGHRVASIEEELLGVADDGEVRRIYAPKSARFSDLFLVHGHRQQRALETIFGADCPPTRIVGNPRIDLLRGGFDHDIRAAGAALRRRHGPYILINTNFASINPRAQDTVAYLELCRAAGVTDPGDPVSMDDFFTWCAWEHENLRTIVRLAWALEHRSLAWRTIIRPHPSEKVAPWQVAFGDAASVSVLREGDHLPWMAGAGLVVHPGSTTGLEAAVLGVPTMNLRCHDNPWHEMYLSTLVNPVFTDLGEAMRAIDAHVAGHRKIGAMGAGGEAALAEYLHLDDRALAAGLMARALADLAAEQGTGAGVAPLTDAVNLEASQASDRKIDQSAFDPSALRARFEALASRCSGSAAAELVGAPGRWVGIRPAGRISARAGL